MTDDAPKLSKVSARQADERKETKTILYVSFAAAAAALGITAIVFAGS